MKKPQDLIESKVWGFSQVLQFQCAENKREFDLTDKVILFITKGLLS